MLYRTLGEFRQPEAEVLGDFQFDRCMHRPRFNCGDRQWIAIDADNQRAIVHDSETATHIHALVLSGQTVPNGVYAIPVKVRHPGIGVLKELFVCLIVAPRSSQWRKRIPGCSASTE